LAVSHGEPDRVFYLLRARKPHYGAIAEPILGVHSAIVVLNSMPDPVSQGRMGLKSSGGCRSRRGLSKRATEPNDVSVRVGSPSLPLSIVLVLRAIHIDACLAPFVSYAISLLAVDVESTMTRDFTSHSLCQVDSEIPVPMSEGIRVIVERHLEARPLEPSDRASHISHFEDRFKPGDRPRAGDELRLTVPLSVEPVKTVVTDRQVRMRTESDPPID
jgi:hypothetical protein